jgi:hypothetical protein
MENDEELAGKCYIFKDVLLKFGKPGNPKFCA